MSAIEEMESRLRKLLEERLTQALAGSEPEERLAQKLAEAMHAGLRPQAGGPSLAPNLYVVIAHPSTLTAWHAEPRRWEALAEALREAGEEAGVAFASRPCLSTAADASMEAGKVRVVASFSGESLPETQNVPAAAKADDSAGRGPDEETPPLNAFLIVGGTRLIPLTEPVVNIGRRLDNHVVVDDPRVSRNHAQMRVIKGRYVIFDLDSTGGTFVNGQRTSQSVLYPGDVISLAGVTIVFGQDAPSARQTIQETPPSPVSANRDTVILKKEDDAA